MVSVYPVSGVTPSYQNPPPVPTNTRISWRIGFGPQYLLAIQAGQNFYPASGYAPALYHWHVDAPEAQMLSTAGMDQCPAFPPGSFDLQYAAAGKKTITATLYFCDVITGQPTSEIAGQTTLSFDAGSSAQLKVGAIFYGDQNPISPSTTLSTDPNNPTMAQAPLGRALTIQAFNQQGQPVAANFSLSKQDVVQEGLDSNALFHDFTAFQYASPSPSEVSLQPVHLGSVLLTVTPSDSSLPAGYVKLVVENPASLGSEHTDVDKLIYPLAHKTGILPQYIKAQIRQETKEFDPQAYRYEPLSPWVGDYGVISRFGTPQKPKDGNLRTVDPYKNYILKTSADYLALRGLPRGPLLKAADVAPRTKYKICCDATTGQLRTINPSDIPPGGDQFVDFLNILFSNDDKANWSSNNSANYKVVMDAVFRQDWGPIEFTAQTTVAGSYGLLQMTYVNAVSKLNWQGNSDGAKNPSFLFDTPSNLKNGGGSIGIATEDLRGIYRKAYKAGATIPLFAAPSKLDQTFVRVWDRYNGKPTYGPAVLGFVGLYLPTPASAIF